MKTLKTLLTIIGLLIFMSCGQSAEQKAAEEKRKMDSIATVTKQHMETKLALQYSIKQIKSEKEMMEIHLTNAKGDLAAANDKMEKIKEWQLGRTSSEREQQIKVQTILIHELGNGIKKLDEAIQTAEQKIKEFETDLKEYK